MFVTTDLNNVLISKVEKDKQLNEVYCWLLLPEEENFFFDFPGNHIDSVVLLEAARQSFKAFTYRHSMNDTGEFIKPGSGQEILASLKSININLFLPIFKGEAIKLVEKRIEKTQIGDNYLLKVSGLFVSEYDTRGEYEVVVMLLDLKLYEQWRDDGVKSLLNQTNII